MNYKPLPRPSWFLVGKRGLEDSLKKNLAKIWSSLGQVRNDVTVFNTKVYHFFPFQDNTRDLNHKPLLTI
jgi:hypothetical protein